MKVVLFCGGLGTRLREHSATIPKPLVQIGYRPIIWHLMRYYSHFGHCDFVLCLGYRGDSIREYFLNYRECMSNDFSWSEGGRKIELHRSDAESWRVTFVETGLHSTVGERLRRVRHLLQNEDVFLANYADGLSDVPLTHMVGSLCSSNATASFLAVPPPSSMHAVEADGEGFVTRLVPLSATQHRMNGGFFVLRNEIFDSIEEGDELVEQPFARLIAARKLLAYNYDGFWQAIDTLKDKIAFDRMEAQDKCPWMIWRK